MKSNLKTEIYLYSQEKPIIIDNLANTYQKGNMYCVLLMNGVVQKFPLQHIFRIIERPK